MVESAFDPSEEEVNQFHQKALDKVQTLGIGINQLFFQIHLKYTT